MARSDQRLNANVAGPFYVDASCIDCGTCWQWDPEHFAPTGSTSHVQRQPQGEEEIRAALLALQACPVAAIGAPPDLVRRTPADGFPALITRHEAGDVDYCGWASRRSFGASSWLVVRPGGNGMGGNVLIDSPRWSLPLARRIAELGGVAAIVLSHRDDVAERDAEQADAGQSRSAHREVVVVRVQLDDHGSRRRVAPAATEGRDRLARQLLDVGTQYGGLRLMQLHRDRRILRPLN
jgi:ferredoxin